MQLLQHQTFFLHHWMESCFTWKSLYMHPAEYRYAPSEGEAFADALDRCRHCVLERDNLMIAVDHNPLLGLFGNRSLDNIPNNWLRNFKERTLGYCFVMHYISGKKNCAPDSLSRHPVSCQQPTRRIYQMMSPCWQNAAVTWENVLSAAILTWLSCSMSSRTAFLTTVETYQNVYRNTINIACYFPQLVASFYTEIEFSYLRQSILESLHTAAQCVTSVTAPAESSVLWPGIRPAIQYTRDRFQYCLLNVFIINFGLSLTN